MSDAQLLLWVRGPGLVIATALFVLGLSLRLVEIYALGRRKDLAPARAHSPGAGWKTLFTRSVPHHDIARRTPVTFIGGYVFHIGLFVSFFLFVPHIEFIREVFGIGWAGLPSPAVDVVAVVTLLALIVMLASRLLDPVKRYLSNIADYWGWLVTFLPMLTGWMAYHHMLLPYTLMLALHILTVELLIISLPFGKLSHTFTLWASRWYNGDSYARKGVAS